MPTTYPEGVYPGERPAKAVARLLTYATYLQVVGLRRFTTEVHVVLGGEGGDVELLLSLGVSPGQIVVAEHSTEACAKIKRRHRLVDVRNADVADVVRSLEKHGARIASINLDFCNVLSAYVLSKTMEVLRTAWQSAPVFSVTMFASREMDRKLTASMRRMQEQFDNSTARGYARPLSRAVCCYACLQAYYPDLSAVRFLAYHAKGATVKNNQSNSSMSVLIGAVGPAPVLTRRHIVVSKLSEQALADELAGLMLQRRASSRHKNNKEASP